VAEAACSEQDVVAQICRIAAEELERPSVSAGDRLVDDLQLDSLELTVLAVGLEDHYRVRLSEHDAAGIATVAELARLVAARAAEVRP
jgi:acyl carrier protein